LLPVRCRGGCVGFGVGGLGAGGREDGGWAAAGGGGGGGGVAAGGGVTGVGGSAGGAGGDPGGGAGGVTGCGACGSAGSSPTGSSGAMGLSSWAIGSGWLRGPLDGVSFATGELCGTGFSCAVGWGRPAATAVPLVGGGVIRGDSKRPPAPPVTNDGSAIDTLTAAVSSTPVAIRANVTLNFSPPPAERTYGTTIGTPPGSLNSSE
jgi:hypothetical protein